MNKQTHSTLKLSYTKKYESARYSILLMLIFTLVNCALLIFGADTYFLFSAQFLYYSLVGAMFQTGKMPVESYDEFGGYDSLEFYPASYLAVIAVVIVIALAVYFVCWLKSKNLHKNWLIAALVLFSIDAVANILWFGFFIDDIIDYVFAAYIIYSLAAGVWAASKLEKLPEPIEEPVAPAEDDFGFAERDFSYSDSSNDNTEGENK